MNSRLASVLLIGFISMLTAEVFAGSSHMWFLSAWGWFITWPLYMLQTVVLLAVALKIERISFRHLYFFGMILALYESWITKVLWTGYAQSTGPGLFTFLGVAIPEFPVLVFFWHPIMSFILPIVSFELLTKTIPESHRSILRATPLKTALILLFMVCIGSFVAHNNHFDFPIENAAVLGSMLLIFLARLLAGEADWNSFRLPRWGIAVAAVYLAALYIGSFFLISPRKIPHTLLPYATVLAFYALATFCIWKSKPSGTKLVAVSDSVYSRKHLLIFAFVVLGSANLFSIFRSIGNIALAISYYGIAILGAGLLVYVLISSVRKMVSGEIRSA